MVATQVLVSFAASPGSALRNSSSSICKCLDNLSITPNVGEQTLYRDDCHNALNAECVGETFTCIATRACCGAICSINTGCLLESHWALSKLGNCLARYFPIVT